jgi:hypothetical protein
MGRTPHLAQGDDRSRRCDLMADAVPTEKVPSDEVPSTKVPAPRWVSLARSAGLGLAIAGTIGVGWNQTNGADEPPRSCVGMGNETIDTTTYRRDPEQRCAWVDAEGELVPVDDEGTPLPR